MLDENLPTYRFRASSDNPLNSLLYFTHNGSEPTADYLIKRPPPSSSPNQYALGLFDIQYANVLYAEVLVKPEWSQPTLSAAEIRANGGSSGGGAGLPAVPLVPRSFAINLYNPDQTVQVTYKEGSWSKDSWEFDVPERSFRLPSRSQLDQENAPEHRIADLIPKVNLRWKRDGRMSRDMTCYMSGKTIGGKKNKEPDITVAFFKVSKNEGAVSIYEPNMARVDVEDRKGLEVVLLLSAEVIRELWLSSRQDVFNTAGVAPPAAAQNAKPSSGGGHAAASSSAAAAAGSAMSGAAMSGAAMSGALHNTKPAAAVAPLSSHPTNKLPQHDPEAEKQREKRVQREQEEIKRMLEKEERDEQRRKQREREEREKQVDRETKELLKKYGPQPNLPPRPGQQQTPSQPSGSGGGGGGGGPWASSPYAGSTQRPQQPPRPKSTDPPHKSSSGGGHVHYAPDPQQNGGSSASGGGGGGGAFKKFGNFLSTNPYSGPGAAKVSGFFGSSGDASKEGDEEERKKRQKALKKRSSQF